MRVRSRAVDGVRPAGKWHQVDYLFKAEGGAVRFRYYHLNGNVSYDMFYNELHHEFDKEAEEELKLVRMG